MFPAHSHLYLMNVLCVLPPLSGAETWMLLVSQRTNNRFPLGSQARRTALCGAAERQCLQMFI